MATPGNYINGQKNSGILGISVDSDEKPQGSLIVTPDTTEWDIYNYHAGKVEKEVVNDWKETLNTLLIFVSTYILTRSITT
jgi:hypothetical protein